MNKHAKNVPMYTDTVVELLLTPFTIFILLFGLGLIFLLHHHHHHLHSRISKSVMRKDSIGKRKSNNNDDDVSYCRKCQWLCAQHLTFFLSSEPFFRSLLAMLTPMRRVSNTGSVRLDCAVNQSSASTNRGNTDIG